MKIRPLQNWKLVSFPLLFLMLEIGLFASDLWAKSDEEIYKAQVITAGTGQLRGRLRIFNNGNVQLNINGVTPGGSYQVWLHETLTDTDTQIAILVDRNGDGVIRGVEGKFKPFLRGSSSSPAFIIIPSTATFTPPPVSLGDDSFVTGFALPLFPNSARPLFVGDIITGATGLDNGEFKIRANGSARIEIDNVPPGSSYDVWQHNTLPDTDKLIGTIEDLDNDGEIHGSEGNLPLFPSGTSAALNFIILPSGTSFTKPPVTLTDNAFVSGFSLKGKTKDNDDDEDDDNDNRR